MQVLCLNGYGCEGHGVVCSCHDLSWCQFHHAQHLGGQERWAAEMRAELEARL